MQMMTAAYLKLEQQGLKDPEVKAINKELRDILEVKTTSAANSSLNAAVSRS